MTALSRRNFLIGASSAAVAVGAGLSAPARAFGIDFGAGDLAARVVACQKMQNEFRKRMLLDLAFYDGAQWEPRAKSCNARLTESVLKTRRPPARRVFDSRDAGEAGAG